MEVWIIIGIIFAAIIYSNRGKYLPDAKDRPRSGPNPWNIIGWVLLALLLIWLYGLVKIQMRASEIESYGVSDLPAYSTPAVKHFVKQINIQCREDEIRVTIENTGSHEIKFAKAYFQAYDRLGKLVYAGDSFFRPSDIPPGSMSSATVYLRGIQYEKCGLVSVQDRDGNRATISN